MDHVSWYLSSRNHFHPSVANTNVFALDRSLHCGEWEIYTESSFHFKRCPLAMKQPHHSLFHFREYCLSSFSGVPCRASVYRAGENRAGKPTRLARS